jgi:hypothetical protein
VFCWLLMIWTGTVSGVQTMGLFRLGVASKPVVPQRVGHVQNFWGRRTRTSDSKAIMA